MARLILRQVAKFSKSQRNKMEKRFFSAVMVREDSESTWHALTGVTLGPFFEGRVTVWKMCCGERFQDDYPVEVKTLGDIVLSSACNKCMKIVEKIK